MEYFSLEPTKGSELIYRVNYDVNVIPCAHITYEVRHV